MATLPQPGAAQNDEDEKQPTTSLSGYKCVFRQSGDSLYLMVRDKTRRAFSNTFSQSTLADIGYKQPVEQILNTLKMAVSGKDDGFQFDARYGNAENIKKVSLNELSTSYETGNALYVFVTVKTPYFCDSYQFKLLPHKQTEMDMLKEMVEEMQEEIDALKEAQTSQPIRVSFNGMSNVSQNKECQLYSAYGISKVIRQGTGQYVVHFETAMKNRNYTVMLTQNMLNTGGVIIGLEGNNRSGDTYYTQTEKSFKIGTRCPRANANRDCDLVHVVVFP